MVSTINTISSGHSSLDVKSLNILPSFFGQRHQEINGFSNVLDELLLSHSFLSNSNTQVNNFFKLELDGSFEDVMFALDGLTFTNGDGDFTAFIKLSSHGSCDGSD